MEKRSMDPILYQATGHVATLTINRPQAMNSMDSFAHLALSDALDRIQADDNIRVVVLTGSGDRAFSAGRDLKEIAAEQSMSGTEQEELAARWKQVRRLTDRHDFFKPIIARVNGLAMGGGFELALACDLIIAAEHATFALPEPKRGLIATAGGVHRLPRQLPLKTAMGLLLTGRTLSAARALELGLVNQVAPAAQLDAVLQSWIDDILACAPLAIQATKQCAMVGLGYPLHAAIEATYPVEQQRKRSDDSKEGPRAFAEKRAPVWTGR
jgi:enoyl-CoA hydratase/carnithine racemase